MAAAGIRGEAAVGALEEAGKGSRLRGGGGQGSLQRVRESAEGRTRRPATHQSLRQEGLGLSFRTAEGFVSVEKQLPGWATDMAMMIHTFVRTAVTAG